MGRMIRVTVAALAAALLVAPAALAKGGHVRFDGGTPDEHLTVKEALAVSKFNFNIVRRTIIVHILPGGDRSEPGAIWLDPKRLDLGAFAWGAVQHEFGHQVDFLVMTDIQRAKFNAFFGTPSWTPPADWDGLTGHESIGRERFASMIAWTFWRDRIWNDESPKYKPIESGADPKKFQALLMKMGLYTG